MKSNLDLFREKYQYINEETLRIAVSEDSELVVRLLLDSEPNMITKSLILMALSETQDLTHKDLIYSFKNSSEAFLRETSYMALHSLYDEDFSKVFAEELKEDLKTEKSPGVRRRIEDLIKINTR